MKKIMILSSQYTGHGHKSISDALVEQLRAYPDVQVDVVEGFELIGAVGVRFSRMYGPLTRHAKDMWGFTFILSSQTPRFIGELMELLIHDKFMKLLQNGMPDLIVSVHAMFVGGVLNILKTYGLDIPMVTMLADIIDIHPSWCDERATLTLCPTQEALESSINHGIPRAQLRMVGFPTRARFTDAASGYPKRHWSDARQLNCLLMSGGEGSGNLGKYAQELLANFNCQLTVICGRNKKLQLSLKESLEAQFGKRVRVLGYCENVQEYMLDADILIARGSPNTLMEGVVCLCPLVITGALPGQEQRNPELITAHNLGVVCPSPRHVARVIGELIEGGGAQLHKIRAAQSKYRSLDGARDIARIIYDTAQVKPRAMPEYKTRIPTLHSARLTMRAASIPLGRIWRRRKKPEE